MPQLPVPEGAFLKVDGLIRQYNPILSPEKTERARFLVANLANTNLKYPKSERNTHYSAEHSKHLFLETMKTAFPNLIDGTVTDSIIGLWCRNSNLINSGEESIIDLYRSDLESNPRLLADLLSAAAHFDIASLTIHSVHESVTNYNIEGLIGNTIENKKLELQIFADKLQAIFATPNQGEGIGMPK